MQLFSFNKEGDFYTRTTWMSPADTLLRGILCDSTYRRDSSRQVKVTETQSTTVITRAAGRGSQC